MWLVRASARPARPLPGPSSISQGRSRGSGAPRNPSGAQNLGPSARPRPPSNVAAQSLHPPPPLILSPQEAKPKAILQKMGAYASQLTTIQVRQHVGCLLLAQRPAPAGGGRSPSPYGRPCLRTSRGVCAVAHHHLSSLLAHLPARCHSPCPPCPACPPLS